MIIGNLTLAQLSVYSDDRGVSPSATTQSEFKNGFGWLVLGTAAASLR